MSDKLVPFVQWVGGKRQLLPELEKRLPKNFNNYFEVFLGGGALLLHLESQLLYSDKKVVVNDLNPVLINAYKYIKEEPSKLMDHLYVLDQLKVDKHLFYQMRDKFNAKVKNNEYDLELAALFIFLQKRTFNGIFRVNKKGEYMISAGSRLNVESYNVNNIYGLSKFLKQIEILNQDFEEVLKNAKKGDFVFLDPPYDPDPIIKFKMNYTPTGFSADDQKRLAKIYKELDQRGCFLMLTNHGTNFIRDLYKEYNIEEVNLRRFLQRSGERKGSEVIIRNYKTEEEIK